MARGPIKISSVKVLLVSCFRAVYRETGLKQDKAQKTGMYGAVQNKTGKNSGRI
jgi:hypothetical protein